MLILLVFLLSQCLSIYISKESKNYYDIGVIYFIDLVFVLIYCIFSKMSKNANVGSSKS